MLVYLQWLEAPGIKSHPDSGSDAQYLPAGVPTPSCQPLPKEQIASKRGVSDPRTSVRSTKCPIGGDHLGGPILADRHSPGPF